MNKKQKQARILKAIEKIEADSYEFACHALGFGGLLVEEFSDLFQDPLQGSNWTFFSLPGGGKESPYPSDKARKNVRLTALWLFYHMQ